MQGIMYPNLFKPLKIGSMTIKNRLIVGPMGGYNFAGPKGEFSERSAEYFVERARGGFGLIFTGVTICDLEVDPYLDGYLSPMYNKKAFIASAIPMIDRIHSYGSKIIIQITLGDGRNGARTAPSDLPLYWDPGVTCRALTREEIKHKINAVIEAAAVSKQAGFDGVEVHAMHEGYLIDEFATAFTNYRTDEYGGSLENRIRPATEIIEGIKRLNGADYPVTIRLGAKSYMKGFNQPSLDGSGEVGRTLEEGIEIARLLEKAGYDALSIDSGNYDSFYYVHPPMYQPKGFNLPLCEEIKKEVRIPVLAAGRIDEPELAEKAILENKADGIVMARASLADPEFPNKALRGKPESIRPCLSCHMGCVERIFGGIGLVCAVNPVAMRENIYKLEPALTRKHVLVIGGGVAGMETARAAGIRGHKVTLLEAGEQLGGNLIAGSMPRFKTDDIRLLNWYKQELASGDIDIRLNTTATLELIKEINADSVVVAVGARPIMPCSVKGIDWPHVYSCVDVKDHLGELGEECVIVGGGLVGCETALEFAMRGKKVTIVEVMPDILKAGKHVPIMNDMMLRDLLASYDVKIKTSCRLSEIGQRDTILETENGREVIKADNVVISIGFSSEKALYRQLLENGIDACEIGDGRTVANIMNAVWDGYEIGRSI